MSLLRIRNIFLIFLRRLINKMVSYKKLQEFAHSDKDDGREFIQALYDFGENLDSKKAKQLLNLLDNEGNCPDAMMSITRILENLPSDEHVKTILEWIDSYDYKYSSYLTSAFYGILNDEESYSQLKKYTGIRPSQNLKEIFLNIKTDAEDTEIKRKSNYEHIEKCNELLKILDESI